jgi:2-oxoglutarate dehydrogenase N-terminus
VLAWSRGLQGQQPYNAVFYLLLYHIITLAMLQSHALRRFRCATGRSRLAVAPKQISLLFHRDLATAATSPSPNDPFANGTNTHYAEEMYRHWRQDPASVHASWDAYFSGLEKGLGSNAFQPPPKFLPAPADGAPALHASGGAQLDDHLKVRAGGSFWFLWKLIILHIGATAGPRIPSARTPCCRA